MSTVVRLRWREFAVNSVIGALLLVIILIPRLADLDALVTPDEPLWVARSANFYQALSSGNLKDTYQYVHPGVPVMWLGALAYLVTGTDLSGMAGEQIETRGSETRNILTAHGDRSMIDVLVDLRISVTIASALVLVILFFCLIPLVGRWPAAAAVFFLSVDPMHIGFTRLLHLDGLSTNLLLVSVVAFCCYVQNTSRLMLLVSAIAAGIAVLTRSANGVLGPLVGLIAAVDVALAWWQGRKIPRQLIRKYILALVIWGVIALLTFVVFWPAMWVAPIDTFRQMWSGGLDLASDPHSRQVLFRGHVTIDDPGWLFYPIVLMYRISPIALFGLGLAAVMAVIERSTAASLLPKRLCLNLILFAGTYIVILSLAAKKLDRYILPSVAALDLVAILGWIAFAQWCVRKLVIPNQRVKQSLVPLVVILVLLGQSALAAANRPYYINEASLLLGGTTQASKEFSFGWGEGGKKVAEALIQIPGIEDKVVLAGPWPMTIDYYLPFEIQKSLYTPMGEVAAAWADADYVVLTEPELQRELYAPEFLTWFDAQTPVAVVMDEGKVYARIFSIPPGSLPAPFYASNSSIIQWGPNLQQVASHVPSRVRVGGNLRIHLYMQGDGQAVQFTIDTDVLAPDGTVVAQSSRDESVDTGLDPKHIAYSVVLPDELPAETYSVRVTIRDASTGSVLSSTNVGTGKATPAPVDIGTFFIDPSLS